jgi:hypothetical protein
MAKALADTELAAVSSEAVGTGMSRIRRDPSLVTIQRLGDAELRSWCEQVVRGVKLWIGGQDFAQVMQTFSDLGREGQRIGIPGRELLHALSILMDACETRDAGSVETPGIVVETQSLRPLDSFHDFAKYYLIRGYEDSTR